MSKSKKYKIKQKDFRKLETLAERIYNTITVIDYFCRTQQEIEELYNLTPSVENLRRDSVTVNAFFINYPDNKNFQMAFKTCFNTVQKVFKKMNCV